MNGENGLSYASSNGNGNFVTTPVKEMDAYNTGYYYNGNNQMLQQQHLADPQQQQQQQIPLQQPQQQQQQQQMPYPISPSPPSMYRYGSGQMHAGGISSPALARALSTLSADKNRRPRSEKKPIPDEQKDDKYYERRRRNNEAAKKSRDARKAREDELAIRASYLEKDNSILKVQVISMREEAMKLRELWVAKCQGLAVSRPNGTGAGQQLGRNGLQNLTQVQNNLPPTPQGRSS